ncbi:hypothetical protein WAI453_008002 [Rhynchosporium graminicola]
MTAAGRYSAVEGEANNSSLKPRDGTVLLPRQFHPRGVKKASTLTSQLIHNPKIEYGDPTNPHFHAKSLFSVSLEHWDLVSPVVRNPKPWVWKLSRTSSHGVTDVKMRGLGTIYERPALALFWYSLGPRN